MVRVLALMVLAAPLAAQITLTNVGGSEYTDGGGRVWAATGSQCDGTAFGDAGLQIADTSDDPLYATGHKATSSFACAFTVASGYYRVRLLFAEIEGFSAGQRAFNVTVNSQTYLSNLDVAARAGGELIAYERDFLLPVPGTSISMAFSRVSGDPFVSAIEISRVDAFTSGSSEPSNCSEGEYFYNTTTNTWKVCTATDTFTAIGSSVGASVDPAEMADSDFGDFTCASGVCSLDTDYISEAELDAEAELEAQLADVANVYTNNDGDLADDNLGNNNIADLGDVSAKSGTTGVIATTNGITLTNGNPACWDENGNLRGNVADCPNSSSGGGSAFFQCNSPSELTIGTGAITVTSGGGCFDVDTESDAASDTLDSITCTAGDAFTLKAESDARTVVVDSSSLPSYGNTDQSLDQDGDYSFWTCPVADTPVMWGFYDEAGAVTVSQIATTTAGWLELTEDTNAGGAPSTVGNCLLGFDTDSTLKSHCQGGSEEVYALISDLDTSAELLALLTDETGTGALVFGTSPTIAAPALTGKIDRNNVSVDDDDCTGERGLYWYDTTDSQFEFCDANSGAPTTLGSAMSSWTYFYSMAGSSGASNINMAGPWIADAGVAHLSYGTSGVGRFRLDSNTFRLVHFLSPNFSGDLDVTLWLTVTNASTPGTEEVLIDIQGECVDVGHDMTAASTVDFETSTPHALDMATGSDVIYKTTILDSAWDVNVPCSAEDVLILTIDRDVSDENVNNPGIAFMAIKEYW